MAPSGLDNDGDICMSDESDFYGSPGEKVIWEGRVNGIDSSNSIVQLRYLPSSNYVSHHEATNVAAQKRPEAAFPKDGDMSYRQSSESVHEFINRLLPSTASESRSGYWIRITNPHGPPRFELDETAVEIAGQKLLSEHLQQPEAQPGGQNWTGRTDMAKFTSQQRAKTQEALRRLAIDSKFVSGKWMLFPALDEVDRIWRTVAEATASNRLGPESAVSTATFGHNNSYRLICVCTKDFEDKDDVRRVLETLLSLGLVDPTGKSNVWYKTDAYSKWKINSDNEYGLPASLYNSKAMLRAGTGRPGRSTGFQY